MTAELLEKVYAAETDRRAVRVVFDTIFQLLDGHPLQAIDNFMTDHGCPKVFGVEPQPRFEDVDALLEAVDLDRCTVARMGAFLAASFTARKQLRAYKPFLDRVHEHLAKTESPERVKSLLQGFDR